MKFTTILLAFCFLSTPYTGQVIPGHGKHEKDTTMRGGSIHLTVDNWKSATEGKQVFVKFYAEWCDHSQATHADWENLNKKYKEDDKILIAQVDCATQMSLCTDHKVTGYPTLKFYKNFNHNEEKGERYRGSPELKFLKKWVAQKMSGKGGEEEEDEVSFDEINFTKNNLTKKNWASETEGKQVFVNFYSSQCGHCKRIKPNWKNLAKTYESKKEVLIAQVDCNVESELCSEHGVRSYPTLKFFKGPNEKGVKYSGARDYESLKQYMGKMSGEKSEADKDDEPVTTIDGLSNLTVDNWDSATKGKQVFVKFYTSQCGHCKHMAPAWKNLAKAYKNNKKVLIAQVDCDQQSSLCNKYGVKGWPTLKFFKGPNEKGVKYSGGRDYEPLKQYMTEMSGEKPEADKDDEAVTTIDGLSTLTVDNWKSATKGKQVFVKFFTPECSYCKQMAPAWKNLAEAYKNNKKVLIAQVDCDQQSSLCKKYGVKGWPTLKFFKDPNEKGVKYSGARDYEPLKQYMGKMSGEKPEADKDDEAVTTIDGLSTLTKANFNSAAKDTEMFVKFYTPECGYCQQIAPAWKNLAKAYESKNEVLIAEVDCDVESELCSEHNLRGYPTLAWFRHGEKVEEYQGGRSYDTLKEYVEDQTSPKPEEVKRDELKELW